MEMIERRRSKRYAAAYPIEDAGAKALDLLDVSSMGVSFASPEPFRPDQKIDIRIFLKKKMFFLQATVVHTNPSGKGLYNVGARFDSVPDGFPENLENEVEDVEQYRRECSRFYNKNFSFKEASERMLKNGFLPM